MSIRFEIAKTLHGDPNKRFIQLKGFPHKIVNSDPDINWSPGLCKGDNDQSMDISNSVFEDSFRPLSIQVGSNQFWTFDTAWGLFEFPNFKVSDMIEQKFINKYGDKNIITHKYEYKRNGVDKSFLLVIQSTALIAVYSTIILASKISREYINTDELYVGVSNDENMKNNIITDCGRVKHYYPFPPKFKEVSEIFDLKNREDLFTIKSSNYKYNVNDIKGISSVEHKEIDGKYNDCIVLDDEYSKKFGDILNEQLEKISRDDITFFIKFKKTLQTIDTKISLTSSNKKGDITEHTIEDVIDKIEIAESKILKLG